MNVIAQQITHTMLWCTAEAGFYSHMYSMQLELKGCVSSPDWSEICKFYPVESELLAPLSCMVSSSLERAFLKRSILWRSLSRSLRNCKAKDCLAVLTNACLFGERQYGQLQTLNSLLLTNSIADRTACAITS